MRPQIQNKLILTGMVPKVGDIETEPYGMVTVVVVAAVIIAVITVTAAPLQIAQHLLCAGHCPESPVNINSLNSHNNSTRQVLLSPFYG